MKIAVDVMSGDNPAEELIKGALKASADLGTEIVLIGAPGVVDRYENREKGVTFVHAESVIKMEDDALSALKGKKDSSLSVGAGLLKRGEADAFVSPGNTGALLMAASILVRRVSGIRRAALGAVVPLTRPFIIVDAGANIDVLPENLRQFAHMGALYAEKVLGLPNPRVALLSNGTEATKGTEVTKEAYRLLEESGLNFIGNIEARELPIGGCDVAVCDGFTGNIALKLIEGMGKFMSNTINGLFRRNLLTKLSYLACSGDVKRLRIQTDTREYGGAPLLGIAKPVIKAHGNSDAKAFYNAVRQAKAYAESGIIQEFHNRFRRSDTNESNDNASEAD